MLQCAAVCCSVLQCVAVSCSELQCVAMNCTMLQCAAVCCNALQCVAARCGALQCVAMSRSVLQCCAARRGWELRTVFLLLVSGVGLDMGWLRSVGSIKSEVSFAEYCLFCRALLQKRPIILSILLTKATP